MTSFPVKQQGAEPRPQRKKLSLVKTWHHQQELTPGRRMRVSIASASGGLIHREGELVAADQFTLKLRTLGGPGDGKEIVLFKHALVAFEVLA